jgi:CheY-like chemotaxis protein
VPRRRILIVEDDADFRDALATALRDAGLEVDGAEDGVDALERLRSGPYPAVVLLDLGLPRLDGEQFLREIRADPRLEHLPVITLTAGKTRAEGDVVARLHKPVDLDDLLAIVGSLVDAKP